MWQTAKNENHMAEELREIEINRQSSIFSLIAKHKPLAN